MSPVTAWTGRMTVPIVSGLAANCSTLWFQQLRRSCLRNCWTLSLMCVYVLMCIRLCWCTAEGSSKCRDKPLCTSGHYTAHNTPCINGKVLRAPLSLSGCLYGYLFVLWLIGVRQFDKNMPCGIREIKIAVYPLFNSKPPNLTQNWTEIFTGQHLPLETVKSKRPLIVIVARVCKLYRELETSVRNCSYFRPVYMSRDTERAHCQF